MSQATENTPEEAPAGDFVKEAPLEALSKEEMLAAARTRSIYILAAPSVTSMSYDVIADMVVKAARVLEPRLDDLCVAEPPADNQAVLPAYEQIDSILFFNDPMGDLWEKDFMNEVARMIVRLLAASSCPVKHTLRGQIIRRPSSPKPVRFALVISVLNCKAPETKKELADGE